MSRIRRYVIGFYLAVIRSRIVLEAAVLFDQVFHGMSRAESRAFTRRFIEEEARVCRRWVTR